MKKFSAIFVLPILLFIVSVGVVSCTGKLKANTNTAVSPKKGKSIEVTDFNKKLVMAKAGDIIKLKLTSSNNDFQWSLKNPITGGYLSLDAHDVSDSVGMKISYWSFKVEKSGIFELLFHYENPLVQKEVIDTFRILIASDVKKDELNNIILLRPNGKEAIGDTLTIEGYARVFEANVNYEVVDKNGRILDDGFITASSGAPEFGFFSKEILFSKDASNDISVKVFQISAKDGLKIDIAEKSITRE